jgi:hypothetical protein
MDVRKARAEARKAGRCGPDGGVALCGGKPRAKGSLLPRRQPNCFLRPAVETFHREDQFVHLQRTLIPFFGDMPMATIQRTDVARWRDSLAARRHIQPRSAGARY